MIGHFMVIDQLGAGACGLVVSAYDPDLDRKVALKVLRPDVLNASDAARARERLLREAKAVAQINHESVVRVHEVGSVGEQIYVAMEYVDGGTLRDTLSLRRRTWRQSLDLFVPAARGLAAAHREGLIHRDFKPANVLVSRTNRVVVTDFGLVSTTGDSSSAAESPAPVFESAITETGTALGTPAYMAPEQHAGATMDARCDQFAYCVALYEALYHQRPYTGTTLAELAEAKRQGPIDPPAESEVPAWLRQAVLRGMSPDPDERFESMDELIAVIDAELIERKPSWPRIAAAGIAAVALIGAYQWLTLAPSLEDSARRIALSKRLADSRAQIADINVALSEARRRGEIREAELLALLKAAEEEELAEVEGELLEIATDEARPRAARQRDCRPGDVDCYNGRRLLAERRAPPVLAATPDKDRTRAVLAGRTRHVRGCAPAPDLGTPRNFEEWERVMNRPTLVYDVGVRVEIAPDGKARRVVVDAGDMRTRACIMQVVKRSRFPASQLGGEVKYRYRL
jgi:tRNA A-37 threonylcarbamoyl transferase component Bud32